MRLLLVLMVCCACYAFADETDDEVRYIYADHGD